MRVFILVITVFLFCSCIDSDPLPQKKEIDDMEEYSLITESEDLEPYVNRKVRLIAVVSNTKLPSIGNYWLTVLELDGLAGLKINIWGRIEKRVESSTLPDGTIIQGRDGEYFHLVDIGYELIIEN